MSQVALTKQGKARAKTGPKPLGYPLRKYSLWLKAADLAAAEDLAWIQERSVSALMREALAMYLASVPSAVAGTPGTAGG